MCCRSGPGSPRPARREAGAAEHRPVPGAGGSLCSGERSRHPPSPPRPAAGQDGRAPPSCVTGRKVRGGPAADGPRPRCPRRVQRGCSPPLPARCRPHPSGMGWTRRTRRHQPEAGGGITLRAPTVTSGLAASPVPRRWALRTGTGVGKGAARYAANRERRYRFPPRLNATFLGLTQGLTRSPHAGPFQERCLSEG